MHRIGGGHESRQRVQKKVKWDAKEEKEKRRPETSGGAGAGTPFGIEPPCGRLD